jgi:uncharacterized protein YutE (UPF0331/DUF86 family)
MGELLLRKAIACRDRIARIRQALPARPEEVASDERLEAYIAFNLFLLVQDAIDLAAHLVVARGLTVPSSHREAFEALARADVLTAEVASGMAAMAALRNRIAHTYGDLDPVRLVREAPTGLTMAEKFLAQVTAAVAATE